MLLVACLNLPAAVGLGCWSSLLIPLSPPVDCPWLPFTMEAAHSQWLTIRRLQRTRPLASRWGQLCGVIYVLEFSMDQAKAIVCLKLQICSVLFLSLPWFLLSLLDFSWGASPQWTTFAISLSQALLLVNLQWDEIYPYFMPREIHPE